MIQKLCVCVALMVSLVALPASAETFEPGSLVIPMDVDYQDEGVFKAFGLVYALLQSDVTIYWVIDRGKSFGDPDFTTDAVDYADNTVITAHGYRGGPFVVKAEDAAVAKPVVDTWQTNHPETTVHETTASFEGDIAKVLVVAPNIAMFADGNEDIARGYMEAAGIPDSTGDLTWPDASPDMLDIDEVSGPTDTNHTDGALFDEDGDPVYCQLMSMHWKIDDGLDNPEVVAEVREYLRNPVHFFAECQAVNAFENHPNGRFLTPYGFIIDNLDAGDPVDFYNADSPFAQLDSVYELVGGSERSYTPCAEEECINAGSYKTGGVVMITGKDTPEGIQDVWMTGFLDGACPPSQPVCERFGRQLGKVSYLGGHEYDTNVPISENPKSAGTRLFLQSLFEAQCATPAGQPDIELVKTGSTVSDTGEVTFELAYSNTGRGVATEAVITDTLPAGATFVSATGGGTENGGVVTWDLGNLGILESGTVSVTVTLDTPEQSYDNTAQMTYKSGTNARSIDSNTASVFYGDDTDGDGVPDATDICPNDPNPAQDLDADPMSCGACGVTCDATAANIECVSGACTLTSCDAGTHDIDGDPANGCEYACITVGNTDETCDGVDDNCDGVTDDGCATADTGADTAGQDTSVSTGDTSGGGDATDTPPGGGSKDDCSCASLRPSPATGFGGLVLVFSVLGGLLWWRRR